MGEEGGSTTAWEDGGGVSLFNQHNQNGQTDANDTPLAAVPSLPALLSEVPLYGSDSAALPMPYRGTEHPPSHLTAFAEGGGGSAPVPPAISGVQLDAGARQGSASRQSHPPQVYRSAGASQNNLGEEGGSTLLHRAPDTAAGAGATSLQSHPPQVYRGSLGAGGGGVVRRTGGWLRWWGRGGEA